MERRDYLIRKIAWALFTVIFVAALNFFMFRILPGDPARALVRDPRLNKQVQDAIRARFGLDKPLVINTGGNPFDSQFFRYFQALASGDLQLM